MTCLFFLKFIYSEKAKIFCEISTLLLTVCTLVKSKVEISQNFVAFWEYMNFNLFFYKTKSRVLNQTEVLIIVVWPFRKIRKIHERSVRNS